MAGPVTDPRRRIPSVDALLEARALEPVVARWGRERAVAALREVQAELRERLGRMADDIDGGSRAAEESEPPSDASWYAAAAEARLTRADAPSLRRVINATGVVLHTNLGRAPLAAEAVRAVLDASSYASLEYDLEEGRRGSRHDHCVGLLRELTGAEAALVVNNNAAALVLALNTVARGREGVISRGELVEIGGSFRVPEIMERSGVRMREVGTTNRTHLRDYEAAVGEETGVMLKVHRSNFRVEGFTTEVAVPELVALGRARGVPVVHDLGSGALIDLETLGLPHETTASEAVAAGADLVSMSGDKLLGGPQAGILLGREDMVARLRANPLARALRPDKMTLAALEATLALYRPGGEPLSRVPALRMLAATTADLRQRAEGLARRLEAVGVAVATMEARSAVGGGALPGTGLATIVVSLEPVGGSVEELARELRAADPPVVGRVHAGRLLLDPRTIAPEDEEALVAAVRWALGGDAPAHA